MLKVLLIISTMGINQTIEFPDMETCLEVRSSVLEQVKDAEALCIPAGSDDLAMKRMDRFFDKLMEMIQIIEERDFDRDVEEYRENYEFR